jgi:eukaryotic-like serine/threonine-protein kinase
MGRVTQAGVVYEPEMTTSPGPSAVRYEPIAQIGRGGMAEVLLALAHAGGGARRLTVLKRIWPELATDPDFVTMFFDEARLAVRLNHPNVVQTYEVLTERGELAIAMEYLDGQPLTRVGNRLLRGPSELALPLRLRIVASVLAGLEHAHTLADLDGTPLEVVHRDVSPQNVFVTYDGHVKLVDFGVAKTLGASHHTRPGALKGKLAYMAPEQLRGAVMDRRADLFAVGVMLWEIVAGRRMWQAMTEVEIVAHLASAQPLPALPSDANLPPGLEAICARALDPDPDRRYQTAADFEMDIERVLVGSADSHARNLGKVVSLAFSAERAERQAIIERAVKLGSLPISTPAVPRSAPAETTPALASSAAPEATPALPLSAPTEAASAHSPSTAAEAAPVDVSLSGLETAAAPVPAPARRLWLRRTATLAGLVAAVVTILSAGGWRRTLADARLAQVAIPAADRLAREASPLGAPAAVSAGPAARQSLRRLPATADPAPSEPQRPRRRHHPPRVDDDATLPPSEDEPQP